MTNPIFCDSPEAATPVQVTAYRTPKGQLFLEEDVARRAAATHRRCESCATPIPCPAWSKCNPCREIEEAQRYAAKPRKPWDGVAMVYSEVLDEYFSSPEDAREAAIERNADRDEEEESAIDPNNLRLVICEPCYAPTIDSDYFSDLMEDPEIPDEFLDVVKAFNAVAQKTVVSWEPGKFALAEIERLPDAEVEALEANHEAMGREIPALREECGIALAEMDRWKTRAQKAEAEVDDPTIRRCIGFARAWGYGYLTVVNLFALRSTNPAGLAFDDDPIGPQTNPHIEAACGGSNLVVCAWGVYGNLLKPGRDREVVKMLRAKLPETRLHHLGLTKHGHPRHPLYLRADATPILWEACNG